MCTYLRDSQQKKCSSWAAKRSLTVGAQLELRIPRAAAPPHIFDAGKLAAGVSRRRSNASEGPNSKANL